jgi:hypothetical protein
MPDPQFEWVDLDLLRPNPWNPNAMDEAMYASAIESIHEFGFVDPVTVRSEDPDRLTIEDVVHYEIIDGEHRWKAAHDHGACIRIEGGWEHHGLRQVPVTNLGVVSDEDAKQLTIVLNETRGTYEPKKMGALLVELVAMKPLPDLLAVLPFDKPKFEELAALPSVDWSAVRPKAPAAPSGARWVERVFRLPAEAAEPLDQAIAATGETTDWQALRIITEHFLATREAPG